jgi:hypothetical protein
MHTVDPSTGEYIIKDAGNNKILSVNQNGTLTNSSYVKSHIDNLVNPISQSVSAHNVKLDNIGNYSTVSGTTTNNSTTTIETIPISLNTSGIIDGRIVSSGCFIKFFVHVLNNGTVSILSYNLDYNNSQNNENVTFQVSGSNLLIRFSNNSGTNNYRCKYTTDFINI